VFIEAKDDGSGGDSWSYRSCKAPVKSLPPTNQHQVWTYSWVSAIRGIKRPTWVRIITVSIRYKSTPEYLDKHV